MSTTWLKTQNQKKKKEKKRKDPLKLVLKKIKNVDSVGHKLK